jgi:hypothetical protein
MTPGVSGEKKIYPQNTGREIPKNPTSQVQIIIKRR